MDKVFLKEPFHSLTDGQISLSDIITKIKSFLEEDPSATYKLVVGSDSHERQEAGTGKRYVQVVTAIVVHRKGFGGKYFWFKGEKELVYSLREKIYAETMQSLSLAKDFVPLLQFALSNTKALYSLEIHVDVGEDGDTREMIREVVGMVTGYGFIAKTKPYSFAASYVADKHT